MRAPDKTYYNMKRLHAMFAVAALGLLAVTLWMLAVDHGREWKEYQRTFRERIEPWMTETARKAVEPAGTRAPEHDCAAWERLDRALSTKRSSFAKWFSNLPLVDALARPVAIEQIWLPQLRTSDNQMPRTDRCTTCHQGIDKPPVWDEALHAKSLSSERGCGLPQPFSSHPRLDLFVGEQSPHPMSQFGCTICHEGQGSATTFAFASHRPNDPEQRVRWRSEHGWFWNRDWDSPMRPERFLQSACLRCHHNPTELEPGERFRDPPASKLLAGYHLVRQLGCFGCHEIKGIDDSGRRIGPDMRLEQWAEGGGQRGEGRGGSAGDGAERARLAVDGTSARSGKDVGTMRKVGPSLRHVADKIDASVMGAWIADPTDFRPTTRMPRLFGLDEHLNAASRETSRRFEPVEILAIAEYLRTSSQRLPPLTSPATITTAASSQRGKQLFRSQGCLACHKHRDFPEGQSNQGSELSRIGAKLRTNAGREWLRSWIRDPSRYSPRTLMPKADLQAAAPANPQPNDPAADIAAYLIASGGWEPRELPPLVAADLDELALLYLSKTFSQQEAAEYLRKGIPSSMADRINGDAMELIGPMTREKKIRYLGRATIRKRGCFGCHDLPGFDDAQGIGPALSDWGRKPESQLGFEQIARFLTDADSHPASADTVRPKNNFQTSEVSKTSEVLSPRTPAAGDEAFYREAILSERREGFLWQKLGAPRSFDYLKTAHKGYNDQLLMGRFALSAADREAIITFILGLVAEPPSSSYVCQPDARGRAIVEGRKVLDQHGCAECHTLDMERWTIEYDPAKFPAPQSLSEHEFLKQEVDPARLAASRAVNRHGLAHAELVGAPQVGADGKLEETEDEEGNPQNIFTLWESAAIAGEVWPVGGAGVLVSPRQIAIKWPPRGGNFARLLYPVALADAKAAGSTSAAAEGWGWVPPSLTHEGRMVQPAWLYEYLLDPPPVRPACVLAMPKFSLSPDEARKLVDYFAAVDGAEFPYTSDPRARSSRQAPDTPQKWQRLDRAMHLLTDRTTYCAKCHVLGSSNPGGEIRTIFAPDLERAGQRLRPEYLRRWLGSPKSVLPYTAMPVNFPSDKLLGQAIYPGNSLDQLDAVMDLLLNYDGYVRHRSEKPKAESRQQ